MPETLHGKVVMEDGTPPPERVVIEQVCWGIVSRAAYTDPKGQFMIHEGQQFPGAQDASAGSPALSIGLGVGSCKLRAALSGYRSSEIDLTSRQLGDQPNLGTIILRRVASVAGRTTSATSHLAPKESREAYERASKAIEKNKWEDARKQLEKAVEIYPQYAEAWHVLGMTLEKQGKTGDASKAYKRATEADDKFLKPYLRLADIAMREQKWQDLAGYTDHVLKLDPIDFPAAWLFHAVASLNLKNFDAAEKSARKAVENDPDHRMPKAEHILGMALAYKGDFAGAVEHMSAYLRLVPTADDAEVVKKQLAEAERLARAEAARQRN